ncbi:MAG: hypothetical protein M1616_01615 [Candidatus Thermoplasmatota archaeon]|jgi:hypothetical protein|nr:hypothetical protein [Candidatus Thermoplasmatota archaeon]
MPLITIAPALYAVVFLIALIIGLVIDGFAIKLAVSVVTGKNIHLSRGMFVSLVSIIIFAILFVIFSIFTPVVGFIVALLGMIYVIKNMVRTSWLGGFGIAIVAWIILVVIYAILSFLFGEFALAGMHFSHYF